MKEDRSEIYVGIFLLVGMALVAGLVLRFSNFGDSFRETYKITVEFADAGGIVRGSEVRLAGAKIGKVVNAPQLKPDSTGITIDLHILDEFRVPENSSATVAMEGLVGDAYVAIKPPLELTGESWKEGAWIMGKSSTLDKIQENAEQTLAQVTSALDDLDRALLKFNDKILGDENLERFDIAVVELTEAIKSLNEKVLGEENTQNLKETLENIRIASANFAESSEKLSPILDRGQEAADKLVPTVEELRAVIGDASTAFNNFSESDGLLKALIEDSQLREDLEVFVRNLREKGILRYKDEAPVTETGERKEGRFRIFGKKRP